MIHPFTPTYVAMAKAAAEIEAGSPSLFDLKAGRAAGNAFLTEGGVFVIGSNTRFEDIPHVLQSWIPSLGQLLGMLGRPKEFIMYDEQRQFRDWFDSYGHLALDWHELALAVVMHEKYGKRWDGKGWVKS